MMVTIVNMEYHNRHPERDEFEAYDKEHQVRAKFVAALKSAFPDLALAYSIGGQISFDVFPTVCLLLSLCV